MNAITGIMAGSKYLMEDDGKVGIHSHYGVILDTTEPTTGVYSIHDLALENILDGNEIDPDREGRCAECDLLEDDHECDMCGMNWQSSTFLLGDWEQDDKGLWGESVNPDDKDGFAAIENCNLATVQVVKSNVIRYGRMCSPCYPGQVDAQPDDPTRSDDTHPQAYYALPEWALRDN